MTITQNIKTVTENGSYQAYFLASWILKEGFIFVKDFVGDKVQIRSHLMSRKIANFHSRVSII